MKKSSSEAKKLTLHRETLRWLDRSGLEKVVGGILYPNTYTTCGTFLCHSDTC